MENTSQKAPYLIKKYLIVGVLVLVVVVAFLAYFNRPQDVIEPGAIRIVRGGEVVKNLTLEELQALPRVEVDKTISSSSNPDEAGVFTGAELKEVLQAADPDLLEDCERVFARAATVLSPPTTKMKFYRQIIYWWFMCKDGRPWGCRL